MRIRIESLGRIWMKSTQRTNLVVVATIVGLISGCANPDGTAAGDAGHTDMNVLDRRAADLGESTRDVAEADSSTARELTIDAAACADQTSRSSCFVAGCSDYVDAIRGRRSATGECLFEPESGVCIHRPDFAGGSGSLISSYCREGKDGALDVLVFRQTMGEIAGWSPCRESYGGCQEEFPGF